MKFTFIGCSLTVGEGLGREKDDPANYTNIVADHLSASVTNKSIGGNSNYNIFLLALNDILFGESDKIFVQWSALNRVWVYPGPNTKLYLNYDIKDDYTYRNIFLSKHELQKISNTWKLLNCDFHLIVELLEYCKILSNVIPKEKQIIFINGLVPWSNDVLNLNIDHDYLSNLSEYTKEILDFHARDDSELKVLINYLRCKLNEVESSLWVNQFNSMSAIQIDFGSDKSHPGVKSHRIYADMIINYLKYTNG